MDPITTHPYLSEEQQRELHTIATALSRPGGGILAADETPKAMEARFASLKIENTPEVSPALCVRTGRGIYFLIRSDESTDRCCSVVPRRIWPHCPG